MRRLLLVLTILTVHLQFGVQAQSDLEPWDGCTPDLINRIEPASPSLNYSNACGIYRECITLNTDPNICQLRAAASLLSSCPPGDATCRTNALLHSAAISLFIPPWYGQNDEDQVHLASGVPYALSEFNQGWIAEALGIYQALEERLTDSRSIMLLFSKALLYGALDRHDEALAAYESALRMNPDEPLVYFARAYLYGLLGRDVEASFDVEWLRQLTSEQSGLAALVAPLVQRYPLDDSRLQEWRYYPVRESGSSPGGELDRDGTGESAYSVQLMNYEEQDAIFAIGMGNRVVRLSSVDITSPGFTSAFHLDLSGVQTAYGFAWDGSDGDGSIYLLPQGDVFIGNRGGAGFEAGSESEFLLAPVNMPDPRNDLHGERCAGGTLSRLRPSMEISVVESFSNPSILLFDSPGGNQLGEYYSELTILPERMCIEDVHWWQVRTWDGVTGWIRENAGSDYLVSPRYPLTQDSFYCPDVPQIRLVSGETGRVLSGLGENNLRSDPSANASTIARIPPNAIFTVMHGPVCADGFAWWQVDYDGTQGWTAEGQGETYWLEPLLDNEDLGGHG